ncbi:hypothetical protein JL721_257 [Aureococcus anophagefferens]|nr:hypothetical protein JL721_257 [Aureococcus anophagefferens]
MTVCPEETRAMREALGQDPLTGEPKWLKRQRKLFTNFVNAKLMDRDISPVTNIFEDLKDGRILYALLEELSGQSLAPIGKIKKKAPLKKAETRIDHVSNLSIVFRYINQTTKITGIGPADVADGNETLILGLLWSLIVFFTARDLGGVDDVSALKKKLLRWAQKRTAKNPDVEVRNLEDSFSGGRAFLAILHDVDAEGSPYEPSAVATDNFKAAFDDAADKYGVPVLLDGDDADLWKEEQGMVTYLAELMKRLPETSSDVAGAALAAAAARERETRDDLVALCKVPSVVGSPACDDAAPALPPSPAPQDGRRRRPRRLRHRGRARARPGAADGAARRRLRRRRAVAWPEAFDAAVANESVVAAGACGKAGAVAMLEAAAALGAADVKAANVEVCLARGDENAPGAFLRDLRRPSTTLVDEPGVLAAVAPESFGVAFGCRGLATLRLEASRGAGPSKAGAPGPTSTRRPSSPRRSRPSGRGHPAVPGRHGLRGRDGRRRRRARAGGRGAAARRDRRRDAADAAGFLSPIAKPFLDKLARAAKAQRPAAFAPAPAYLPLAAAVAAALPNAATYGVGGPATRLGATGEAAAFGDLHGAVKTLIKLLAALKAVPKRTNAAPVDAAALFP